MAALIPVENCFVMLGKDKSRLSSRTSGAICSRWNHVL